MNDPEFAAVIQLARESLMWRICQRATLSWQHAWPSSSLVRSWMDLRSASSEWSSETRVRFAALTVAWAALGYAICLVLLPRYVMSALPLAWIVSVIVAALMVAALADRFVTAWRARGQV